MNQPENAIKHYQKAIELNPLAPVLHRALAEVYILIAKPAKAKESFDRAMALHPLSIRKYYLQHFYQRLTHQHIADFFSQMDAANCQSSHDCQTLALMLYSLNAIEAGRNWQQKTMAPRYLAQHAKLWMEIQYLAASGDLSNVVSLLEQRVELENTPRHRQQLVDAYLATGEVDNARRTLTTLVPQMANQVVDQDNFEQMIGVAHLLILEHQTRPAQQLLDTLAAWHQTSAI